jgi:dTDP-glucose pyrophosphorylase
MKVEKNSWTDATLIEFSLIGDAIKTLNKGSLKIVLVVNSQGKLLGTISDGDIRRGILKGLTIDDPIEKIIHSDSIKVTTDVDKNEVIRLMKTHKIQQIPIVDSVSRVVGLHLWDELDASPQHKNMFVIMAGGKGTRLMPHTENRPKPMMLIGGKPILEHILLRAKSQGFSNFVISTQYLANVIEDYFGTGEAFGMNISYVREQQPLGTAGALSLIELATLLPIVVTNGDVLSEINYSNMLDFHNLNQSVATMAVSEQISQNPFGVVSVRGLEIVKYEEKPVSRSLINAGVYILNSEVVKGMIPNKSIDMPTLFEQTRNLSLKTIAYPIHERWTDIGRPEDLIKVNNEEIYWTSEGQA